MAISGSHLTNNVSGTAGTSFATASITPTANALVIVGVHANYTGTVGAASLTGNGMTWVKINEVTYNTHDQLSVFRGQAASPTTGAITITLTQNAGSCGHDVDQFTGTAIDTANNGAAAVLQSPTPTTNAGSTTPSQTLNALQSSNSAAYCFLSAQMASGTITKGGSFTQLANQAPGTSVAAEWALNQTVCNWTLSVSSPWATQPLEIVPPLVVAPVADDTNPAFLQYYAFHMEKAVDTLSYTGMIPVIPSFAFDLDTENQKYQDPWLSDDVEYDDHTIQIFLPAPAWDTDADYQLQWPDWFDDRDVDVSWQLSIILPPPAWDTDADYQKLWADWYADFVEYDDHAIKITLPLQTWELWDCNQKQWPDWDATKVEYDDHTIKIFLPAPAWDTDADNQLGWPDWDKDRLVDDWQRFIILPRPAWPDEIRDQIPNPGWDALRNTDDDFSLFSAWSLPPWDPSAAGGWDTDGDHQKQWFDWTADRNVDVSWQFLIILPPPAWDTDADNQLKQPDWYNDKEVDSWQRFIILPPPAWDTDADNQISNDWKRSNLAEYDDHTLKITLPVVSWDTDADNQLPQPNWVTDRDADAASYIYLGWFTPPWNPASGGGWDDDARSQFSNDYTVSDLVEYDDHTLQIFLPPPAWDDDARDQIPELPRRPFSIFEYPVFWPIPAGPPVPSPCDNFVPNAAVAANIQALPDITLLDMIVNAGPNGWWSFCLRRYAAQVLMQRVITYRSSWLTIQNIVGYNTAALTILKAFELPEFALFLALIGS